MLFCQLIYDIMTGIFYLNQEEPLMNHFIEGLQNSSLFCGLSEDVIRQQILPLGKIQEYAKGTYLIMPQERLDSFGVVISGLIHVIHVSMDGNIRLLDALEPGKAYGADLIYTRSRISPYHAMAPQPSQVMLFPVSMLLEPGHLSEEVRHHIQLRLLTIISHENMRKDYRLAILSQKGLRERILTYLTMQAGKRCTETFTIPFSREELANVLCVNRSALSHELALMKQEGILDFQKNTFTLLHPQTHLYEHL